MQISQFKKTIEYNATYEKIINEKNTNARQMEYISIVYVL